MMVTISHLMLMRISHPMRPAMATTAIDSASEARKDRWPVAPEDRPGRQVELVLMASDGAPRGSEHAQRMAVSRRQRPNSCCHACNDTAGWTNAADDLHTGCVAHGSV